MGNNDGNKKGTDNTELNCFLEVLSAHEMALVDMGPHGVAWLCGKLYHLIYDFHLDRIVTEWQMTVNQEWRKH